MRGLLWTGVALVVLAGLASWVLPGQVDRRLNQVERAGPDTASPAAQEALARARVVDLHADPLLWDRDLLERLSHGQVDLPRLLEGHVAIQVFGLVTQSPSSQNFERTPAEDPDTVTLLAVLQRWPLATWRSRFARAVHQAGKLHDAAERSEGRLTVIRTRADLEELLAARAAGERRVGGLLGLEGMHALDGELGNVDRLFEAGLRMMAPTHFFDNRIGGSSAGVAKHGLTELGRQAIGRLQELGIVVDVAHASPRTIDDLLGLATAPLLASHTGVKATCPGPRNLSDDQIRGIASTGGVVGIGYFEGAVCGTEPAAIAAAMAHVRRLVGSAHVALGSDFDGAVTTAFDTTGLALLVDALRAEGFDGDEIQAALGGNALRVFRSVLPAE
ncbi:MAG: peptidase M19 [Deltaproteobacteria bacterium]|jgi:microsomal dipeptidase-like Zn-dependent dipeptidase|nr:peptidase M19 [Deltaproteobacteria bacterium]